MKFEIFYEKNEISQAIYINAENEKNAIDYFIRTRSPRGAQFISSRTVCNDETPRHGEPEITATN